VSPKQLAVELSAEAHRKGEGGQVTEVEALAMIQAFFLAFPGVLEWHKDVERQLIQNRTIVSLSGRERHWPGRIMDRTGTAVMREVLKEAYSFGPQEVGARVLAEGMIHLAETCPSSIHLMVHVHDACLMQTPTALLESAKEIATKALSREMYGMWFPCDMKVGMNWYEAS
jgi:DNA polymerase I-like protein with 3'-5' exonuclease and polymerase domains